MEKKEDRTREKREHKENGVLEGQERDMKKRVVQYQMSQSACTHTHTHAHAQTYTHTHIYHHIMHSKYYVQILFVNYATTRLP